MNLQALHVGLKSFINFSSFAATPRSLKIGQLGSLRFSVMGSKRGVLSLSKSAASSIVDDKKDKKLKGMSGGDCENAVVEENYREVQSVEIPSINDDPAKIEVMTVQELRTALRKIGIPAKGRKAELVSALKHFMAKKIDGDRSVKVGTEIVTTKKKLSIKTDDLVASPQAEPWTILAHKKPQKGWIPYNPRTMRPTPLTDANLVKLMSWNVNGLRALLKVEGFSALELARRENFDVLCMQETKLQEKDVTSFKQCLIDGYENSFWTCSNAKLGYSGTAIVSRIKPLSVHYGLGIPDHDSEGRVVTAEFDSFYLVNAYVPNSGDGLKRLSYRITQWDPSLSNYMKELEKSKPVILTGDLNCAHQEIDIYDPAGNKRSAGFTEEERQSFGSNFLSNGFVDTFRKQHPNVVGYTYWGYRHGARKTNKGWRLDYFLVSESIANNVHDSYTVPDVVGSDHCPIGLVLKI